MIISRGELFTVGEEVFNPGDNILCNAKGINFAK